MTDLIDRTQNHKVYLRLMCGSLTSLQAIRELGITRLSARVYELRAEGHNIISELRCVKTRNGTARVAQYTLLPSGKGGAK